MWKRKVRVTLFVISILAMISLGYFQQKLAATISFSHDSGFYEDEFVLTISGNAVYTLRYTLDGSMPDETSQIYEKPLLIDDASKNANVYSARTETSAGFLSDAGYVTPDYLIDKCNVIRVAQFDSDGVCVSQATRVYFVGFDNKNSYDNMPIISIVTDPDNLFDYEYGIYVMGALYDDPENEEKEVWNSKKANYNARGMDWEREADIDIFDENRNLIESCKAGVRIHGGASRAHAQKSLNLYARSCYSGSDVFSTDFFGNGKSSHKLILAAQGNDDKVKIKNYIVQKLAEELDSDCATTKMIPYVLFLDGEYWGVYYLSEAYDENYINAHYGVDADNVVMMKNGGLEVGEDEDYDLYYNLISFISNNDMRLNENYEKACEMIDMESFVDYYAIEMYVANQDWLPNNCALWRTKDSNSRNQYCDEKWRWMLFDTDRRAVLIEADDDTIQHAIEKDPMFASLIKNEEVQEMLRQKLMEIQDVYEENCDQWINNWMEEMSVSVYQNGERFWGENGIDDDFRSMIAEMRIYPQKREEYLTQYIKQHFDE